MSTKEQKRSNDKVSSKQRSPMSTPEKLDRSVQQQTHSATLIQRAKLDPTSLTPREVQQLQRAIGNQAVTKLLTKTRQPQVVQPKPMVGSVNDQTERKADLVGAQVISLPTPAKGQSGNTSTIQQHTWGEKENVQTKLLTRANAPEKHDTIIQRLHGAVPQNFAITGGIADTPHVKIDTNKTWVSSTGNLADLSDIEMREHVTFNHNPANDIPSYPLVVPTIPGMALVGNVLTKVAGAMHTGGGTDTHSGAGYGTYFTHPTVGIPNLARGAWTLIGTQQYQYRDRGANGPWTPLHAGDFTLTRTMAMNPATHEYELTFNKTGPGINITAGPTPITMTSTEAMQDIGAARPDQTPLWNLVDANITHQEHEYHTVANDAPLINGVAVPVDYQITRPRTAPPQSPGRAAFAPFETLTAAEYNPLITNIRAALTNLIQRYMNGLALLPARVEIIFTKLNAVQQQACYIANGVGGPTLRILFRYGKFATVDPTSKDTSMAGRESKRPWKTANKNRRWQIAVVTHEMGHLLHAFNDINKFQAATVNATSAGAAPVNLQPQMFKMAAVNQQIINALNAKNYKGKWQYAQDNPGEVVAEVWTALMHDQNVPRGLAAVYLAYGGMRNAAIDNKLRKLFPHRQIPVLNKPEDALPFI